MRIGAHLSMAKSLEHAAFQAHGKYVTNFHFFALELESSTTDGRG
jgi:hypothetical protein